MTDVMFYTFEFELIGIMAECETNWTLKYNDIGNFEVHFDPSHRLTQRLIEEDYILAVQGENQAMITGKQLLDECVLYGRTLNYLLSKRVTQKFKSSELFTSGAIESKDIESIARYVVSQAFSDVSNFELGEIIGFAEPIDFWRNTSNLTSDVVRDCLENDGAGHRIRADVKNKKWIFEVLKGQERFKIVSEGNRNAYETKYTDDALDYCSGGWYEEQQEAQDGNAEMPESIWKYIEKDTKTGIYRWEGLLNGSVESEAKSDLKKKQWQKKVETKTYDYVFGEDYNLGDTVRVQKTIGNFKKTFAKRIIGVNMWVESNNIGQKPIFEEG